MLKKLKLNVKMEKQICFQIVSWLLIIFLSFLSCHYNQYQFFLNHRYEFIRTNCLYSQALS